MTKLSDQIEALTVSGGDELNDSQVIRTFIGDDKRTGYTLNTSRHDPSFVIRVFVDGQDMEGKFTVTQNQLGISTILLDDPAPLGSQVVIASESPLRQIQDWRPFGPFEADKTELGVDRLIIAKQELALFRGNANIFWSADDTGVTIISDKGDDAFVDLWELTPGDEPTIEAGMFAGQVGDETEIPFDGATVQKPKNFLYMMWDNLTDPLDIVWDSATWLVDAQVNEGELVFLQNTETGRAYVDWGLSQILDNWHREAPSPTEPAANYEMKLEVLSGDAPAGGTTATWIDATSNSWVWTTPVTGQYTLEYRKKANNADYGLRQINLNVSNPPALQSPIPLVDVWAAWEFTIDGDREKAEYAPDSSWDFDSFVSFTVTGNETDAPNGGPSGGNFNGGTNVTGARNTGVTGNVLDTEQAFTMSGWVKFTAVTNLDEYLLVVQCGGAAGRPYKAALAKNGGSKQLVTLCGDFFQGSAFDVVYTDPYTIDNGDVDNWLFLSIMYDPNLGVDGSLGLKINDQPIAWAALTRPATGYGQPDTNFGIGMRDFGGDATAARFAQVHAFKRILTDAEFEWLYNAGVGRSWTEFV